MTPTRPRLLPLTAAALLVAAAGVALAFKLAGPKASTHLSPEWPSIPPPDLNLGGGGVYKILDFIDMVSNPSNGFIVGGKHAQLGKDLQNVSASLRRLFPMMGGGAHNPAELPRFRAALDDAINRAGNIASRDTEDAASVEFAHKVKARLEQVRDSLPPP